MGQVDFGEVKLIVKKREFLGCVAAAGGLW